MLPAFCLAGRAALITGASRNIGAAVARCFAEAGADLLLVARGSEPLEILAGEIRAATGRQVVTLAADVASPADIGQIIAAAERHFPGIAILVNNAYSTGETFGKPFLDLDWSAWERCIAANLEAPFRLSQALAPQMREKGSVINMLSTAAFSPVPGFGPYGATKSALWTMTRYLAKEYAPRIRFNAICPGTIAEDGGRANAAAWEKVLPTVPMARIGLPDELAPAALFLASDASSYMTGQVVFVDGGRVSAASGV